MDGEQLEQYCCRLSVAVGASPSGRLIAQFVTAAREPALERRHGTTTGSVASAGKQAWTRQQDAAEGRVNPTQDPVLDAKPAAAAGTGACQFDDFRRLGFDELVLNRPEESLRIIEGQSDVAVCHGAAVSPDNQDTMLPRLGARVGELECHKHAHGAPSV